jgi:hypothetical protein
MVERSRVETDNVDKEHDIFPDDPSADSWTANNIGERKFMVRVLKFVPGKTLFEISPW